MQKSKQKIKRDKLRKRKKQLFKLMKKLREANFQKFKYWADPFEVRKTYLKCNKDIDDSDNMIKA